MELIYSYLIGPRFKMRVQSVVEKFNEMADDLRKERTLMTRSWAKREGQIQGMVDSTVGMCGDFDAIIGKDLATPEILLLPKPEK